MFILQDERWGRQTWVLAAAWGLCIPLQRLNISRESGSSGAVRAWESLWFSRNCFLQTESFIDAGTWTSLGSGASPDLRGAAVSTGERVSGVLVGRCATPMHGAHGVPARRGDSFRCSPARGLERLAGASPGVPRVLPRACAAASPSWWSAALCVPHSVPRVSTLSFPPAALPSLPPPRGRLLVLQQQPTCGASGTQKQGLAPGGTEGSNEWVSGCVGKGTSGVPALQEPLAPGPHTLSDWRPSLPCHPCSTTASRAPHPRRRPPAAGRRPVCSHLCDPLSSSPHVWGIQTLSVDG